MKRQKTRDPDQLGRDDRSRERESSRLDDRPRSDERSRLEEWSRDRREPRESDRYERDRSRRLVNSCYITV